MTIKVTPGVQEALIHIANQGVPFSSHWSDGEGMAIISTDAYLSVADLTAIKTIVAAGNQPVTHDSVFLVGLKALLAENKFSPSSIADTLSKHFGITPSARLQLVCETAPNPMAGDRDELKELVYTIIRRQWWFKSRELKDQSGNDYAQERDHGIAIETEGWVYRPRLNLINRLVELSDNHPLLFNTLGQNGFAKDNIRHTLQVLEIDLAGVIEDPVTFKFPEDPKETPVVNKVVKEQLSRLHHQDIAIHVNRVHDRLKWCAQTLFDLAAHDPIPLGLGLSLLELGFTDLSKRGYILGMLYDLSGKVHQLSFWKVDDNTNK